MFKCPKMRKRMFTETCLTRACFLFLSYVNFYGGSKKRERGKTMAESRERTTHQAQSHSVLRDYIENFKIICKKSPIES